MNNPFYINPLGGVRMSNTLNTLSEQRKRDEAIEHQRQQESDEKQAFAAALDGTPESMQKLAETSPKMFQWMDNRQANREQKEGLHVANIKKKAEQEWLIRYDQALQSEDSEAQQALIQEAVEDDNNDLEHGAIGKDPQSDKLITKAALFNYMGKDGYKELYGASGGADIGTASPKDFTVESLAKYQDSGNISDLERFSPKTVKVGGVEHQLNPESQKWEPIIDATSESLGVQAKALADIAADKKSRTDFSASKTKWNSGRPKFRSKISSARSNQKILEATAKQIKEGISAWTTEYGSALSGLPSSDAKTLRNQLNTLKAHSAFSTLSDLKESGGTLGAISAPELVLLEAKLGALDQSGESEEMLRVIDQIVNSNIETIGRLEKEFDTTNSMYSGTFDDFQDSSNRKVGADQLQQQPKPTQTATGPNGEKIGLINGQWVKM